MLMLYWCVLQFQLLVIFHLFHLMSEIRMEKTYVHCKVLRMKTVIVFFVTNRNLPIDFIVVFKLK